LVDMSVVPRAGWKAVMSVSSWVDWMADWTGSSWAGTKVLTKAAPRAVCWALRWVAW